MVWPGNRSAGGSRGRSELIGELRRHVRDQRVIEAIAAVPRDLFVPRDLRRAAWEDRALPLPEGQSISQPRVVAEMCELLRLRGSETVLDVGTGSGYHAAVLARLAARVISVERRPRLAERARADLRRAGVENVTVIAGDGSRGFAPEAPYEAINVAAAAPGEPDPALLGQLADGGRLIVPVDDAGEQRLVLYAKRRGRIERRAGGTVRFVPLVPGSGS